MGTLVIDRDAPSFESGVAHVWVEATAPADASAERLGEARLEGVGHHAGRAEQIPFVVRLAAAAPGGNVRLRAWVDVDGQGPAALGDLFSTEAVVLPADPCVVRVEDPTAGRGRGEHA